MRSAQSTASLPEVNQLATGTCAVAPAGDLEEGDPRQDERDGEEPGRDKFGAARADPAAEQAGDQEAEQRQEDDQIVHGAAQPFSELMSSTAIEPRLR